MSGDRAGAAPEQAEPNFEQSLQRLEEIVHRLEEGSLSLDESLRLYEQGMEAFGRCQKMLQDADLKIRKLVATAEGELREEPFEPPEQ